MFGMQWPGGNCQCFIGHNADYAQWGKSTNCDDKGNGGGWANEVYVLESKGTLSEEDRIKYRDLLAKENKVLQKLLVKQEMKKQQAQLATQQAEADAAQATALAASKAEADTQMAAQKRAM
jgi:hypothetical protein